MIRVVVVVVMVMVVGGGGRSDGGEGGIRVIISPPTSYPPLVKINTRSGRVVGYNHVSAVHSILGLVMAARRVVVASVGP